jgi:hypothetical protein
LFSTYTTYLPRKKRKKVNKRKYVLYFCKQKRVIYTAVTLRSKRIPPHFQTTYRNHIYMFTSSYVHQEKCNFPSSKSKAVGRIGSAIGESGWVSAKYTINKLQNRYSEVILRPFDSYITRKVYLYVCVVESSRWRKRQTSY